MTSRNRSRSTLIYSKYRATQKSISNQFGAVCITTSTHALLFVSWVDAHTHTKNIESEGRGKPCELLAILPSIYYAQAAGYSSSSEQQPPKVFTFPFWSLHWRSLCGHERNNFISSVIFDAASSFTIAMRRLIHTVVKYFIRSFFNKQNGSIQKFAN